MLSLSIPLPVPSEITCITAHSTVSCDSSMYIKTTWQNHGQTACTPTNIMPPATT